MSETSIAEPLSGSEVIDAIAYRVKEMLARDCFLSANSAYEAFTCNIKIDVQVRDIGRTAEIKQEIKTQSGELDPEDENVYLNQAEQMFGEAPPNVVRAETEQPVPVMTEDSSGKQERKMVRYTKKKER